MEMRSIRLRLTGGADATFEMATLTQILMPNKVWKADWKPAGFSMLLSGTKDKY